ncbi:hypothetical protein [Acidithiobacillus sp.]|uniref:hypothetical protein n=1 Tax=Acidithiobacillus sp. TaxID=1872118 RepID=UPI0032AEED8B
MLKFLGRLVFLVILVIIVLLGIVAIQHPDTWQHDWQTMRSFFVRQWNEVQGKASPPSTAKPAPPPEAVAPQAAIAVPAPVPTPPTALAPIAAPPHAQEGTLSNRQLTLLMAARRAYWQGDFPVAITDYQALITARPDQAALYGELGNVLWRSGQSIAAATAYAHAGNLLLMQGKYRQAAALIPILSHLDPGAAQHLQQELAQ